jgi:hypothetical protein
MEYFGGIAPGVDADWWEASTMLFLRNTSLSFDVNECDPCMNRIHLSNLLLCSYLFFPKFPKLRTPNGSSIVPSPRSAALSPAKWIDHISTVPEGSIAS